MNGMVKVLAGVPDILNGPLRQSDCFRPDYLSSLLLFSHTHWDWMTWHRGMQLPFSDSWTWMFLTSEHCRSMWTGSEETKAAGTRQGWMFRVKELLECCFVIKTVDSGPSSHWYENREAVSDLPAHAQKHKRWFHTIVRYNKHPSRSALCLLYVLVRKRYHLHLVHQIYCSHKWSQTLEFHAKNLFLNTTAVSYNSSTIIWMWIMLIFIDTKLKACLKGKWMSLWFTLKIVFKYLA